MSNDPKKKNELEDPVFSRGYLNQGTMVVPLPEQSSAGQGVSLRLKEFVCGGGAAFCNIMISYPLNKLIFRQMLHGVETSFALSQLQNEGLSYLYRGMLPPLLQRSMSMSLMFGIYDGCLQPLLSYKVNPYISKIVAGMVAGCFEATLMPLERVQTLLIHPQYHLKFKNTADAFGHIAKHYGIKEFYRGLFPILLRNGPSNACFFIIRDELSLRLPHQQHVVYQSLQNFLAGASIGAFLSTIFYPLNVIKISMQSKLGGPHNSLVYEFRYILKKRDFKLANFYHGALLNISRAFLSWGIINASYEVFRKIVFI